jgi:hypothetical protein
MEPVRVGGNADGTYGNCVKWSNTRSYFASSASRPRPSSLRAVARDDIRRALDSGDEVKSFTQASEKLQVALRKVVEPDRL